MKTLLLTTLCGICCLAAQSLSAQLSVDHAAEELLPVKPEHCYFVNQNNQPLPDLKELLLGKEVAFKRSTTTGQSLVYRPHLAFFCRVEVRIDQAVGTPFRFRLGSVDYVDYLEGKRNSY